MSGLYELRRECRAPLRIETTYLDALQQSSRNDAVVRNIQR